MAEATVAAQPSISRRVEIWLPVLIILVDQFTKALIRRSLEVHESVTVIPGFFDLTHVRNTGAAYGFLDNVDFPFKTPALALVATIALIGMAIYTKGLVSEQLMPRLGLALIIGGAAGNLIDRLWLGSVVDFVDVYFGDWHFWAFNVADSAITVGVIVMLLDMIGVGSRVSKTA